MIGIDTNILLRLWLNDAPAQNRRIDALLAEHGNTPGSLLVTDVVLAEALWTLRSAYQQDKAAQALAVHSLLDETAFAFEDRDAVSLALDLFERNACGFSDCLVARLLVHGDVRPLDAQVARGEAALAAPISPAP